MSVQERSFMMKLQAWRDGKLTDAAVLDAAQEYARVNISPECAAGDHKRCSFPDRCEHRAHYARRKDRFRVRGQSKEAQEARLSRGLCPVHGVVLAQTGVAVHNGKPYGDEVACSRTDCSFTTVIKPGDDLWRTLHGDEESEEKAS